MSGVHKKSQPIRKSALVLGRRVSSSFSKRSDPEKRPSRPTIRLVDEYGTDLTPLPLLNEEKRIREEKDISTEVSQASIHSGSSLHITNPFTFTRSFVSGSSPTGESHSETSEEADRYRIYTEVKTLVQPQRETLTEADLNKLVDVIITETETFWIFDQPPKFVSQDSSEAPEQIKRNEIYKALVASRIGNDRYTERGMNTFNPASIGKQLQTERIGIQEKSTMATNWDMADTYAEEEEKRKLLEDEDEVLSPQQKKKTKKTKSDTGANTTSHDEVISKQNIKKSQLQPDDGGPIENMRKTGGDHLILSNNEVGLGVESSQLGQSTTTNTMGSNSESDLMGFRDNIDAHINPVTNALGLLETPKMKKDLNHMERALNLNTYYDKLLKYQSLVLSKHQSQDSAEQPDTDSPSTTAHIPAISTAQTVDDNSAGHVGPQAKTQPQAFTTTTSLGSVNPTISGSQGGGSGRTSDFAKVEDANPQNPHTISLWRFQCPMTKGRNIADMAWNKQNPNILAVGYGQFEYDQQRKGLVCCWSLKFIEYPERYYETPSGVTAVGWSKIHANLLAVGMFSGVIHVYDVRKNDPVPVVDTTHAIGRHLGPIRKLQWIVRESGRAEMLSEVLVSVSSDGRVTQWFIRKGFESTDLMVLKRAYANSSNSMSTSKRNDALISRTAIATSMAFNKREPSIYLVGAENGLIHKCSCSYNEQYLETYRSHVASVYHIEWSPFIPDVFLSCSADMTIKLWHSEHQQPLITIQTNMTTVPSLSWSPHNSLTFAVANESFLEIWNLDYSTVDPYVTETVSNDTNMTSVLFSETSQSVLIGDDQGTVHVYNLADFPDSPVTESEQVFQLTQFLNTCLNNLQ